MKVCQAGAELFHVNGWTDRHNKAFHSSVNMPKTGQMSMLQEPLELWCPYAEVQLCHS
jgi:hypothetical protein